MVYSLTKATADAAVRLHGVLVAVALGQTGAVVVAVSTGVGGVGRHPLTQPTALRLKKNQRKPGINVRSEGNKVQPEMLRPN